MELFWRMWVVASGVIMSVGILLVTLVTLEFKRDYDHLLGERMLVIGASAAAPFSAAAELGLPIKDVRNASALLDIPRQTDPLISGVWVLDAQHNVVQGTGQQITDITGLYAPPVAGKEPRNGWYAAAGSAFVAGIPIRNASAEKVGQLVLLYPQEVSRTRVLAMAAELSFLVMTIAVVASLVTGLVLRVWMAREIRGFNAVMTDLAEAERSVWIMQGGKENSERADSLRGKLKQSRVMYGKLIESSSERKGSGESGQEI